MEGPSCGIDVPKDTAFTGLHRVRWPRLPRRFARFRRPWLVTNAGEFELALANAAHVKERRTDVWLVARRVLRSGDPRLGSEPEKGTSDNEVRALRAAFVSMDR